MFCRKALHPVVAGGVRVFGCDGYFPVEYAVLRGILACVSG